MKHILKSPWIALLFVVLVSIPAVLPIIHKGYYPTQDGEWAVIRASDMFRELHDHQIPPRVSGVLYFSYGYPLFNFAYPFPYYLATILHFFKFGFISSVKFLFLISTIFSGIFMFLGAKKLWGNTLSGIVSSVLFVYFPYRFVDLYFRGSLGESVSFALFAVIIWCAAGLYEKPSAKIYMFISSISYGVLVMAHNIMIVYFSIILIFLTCGMLLIGKKRVAFSFLTFIFFGILLSAFFWLPAFTEKNLVLLSKIPIADRGRFFATSKQVFLPILGYVDRTTNTGFSYNLGVPQLFIVFTTGIFLLITFVKRRNIFKDSLFLVATVFFFSSIFFLLGLFSISSPLWKLPVLKEINFSWTMQSVLGFLTALLGGFLATFTKGKYVMVIIAFCSFFILIPSMKTQGYIYHDDLYYATNDATTTASFEFTPLWVKKFPTERPHDHVLIIKGKGNITNETFVSNKTQFTTLLDSKSTIRVNTFYYPGWQVTVDGKKVVPTYNNDYGVMDFSLEPGMHSVLLRFSETPGRLTADIVSIVGLAMLIFWIFLPKTMHRKTK